MLPPVTGFDDGIGYGVSGSSSLGGYGVHGVGGFSGVDGVGVLSGVNGNSDIGIGVHGRSNSSIGVGGISGSFIGVSGTSDTYIGVAGFSNYSPGVVGDSHNSYGVYGSSNRSFGVVGASNSRGVWGSSYDGHGVHGDSHNSNGVYGYSDNGNGVYGRSSNGYGVYGSSDIGYGVYGYSSSGLAAYLDGNVTITGTLQKGGGSFKIDHPLDPANKYLSHSFVESPDMKNVYDGVVVLDDKGEAEIELPDWFGALNKDFRYQLTAIGAPGPNLYIAEEISDGVTNYSNSSSNNNKNNNKSRFKIAGGTSGMKVSWQVTGIRQDPYAKAHPIQVEEDKPAKERGYYLYPDLYGQPAEKGISHLLFPEEEKQELLINDHNKLT